MLYPYRYGRYSDAAGGLQLTGGKTRARDARTKAKECDVRDGEVFDITDTHLDGLARIRYGICRHKIQ